MAGSKQGVKLNTDTGFLKLVAMITMLIDHIGVVLYPNMNILRIIGRISFPIYAYCIAVGCIYTRNALKYALRVLVLAIISQPIYVIALKHVSPSMNALMAGQVTFLKVLQWYGLSMRSANILFTLLLGILLIWSIREKRYIITGALVLLVWQCSSYISYQWRGVALMLIFYAFIDQPLSSFFWAAGFMIWWGATTGSSVVILGWRFALQIYAVLALVLIYIPTNTKIKLPKWIFYLFYPLHMLALYGWALYIK